MVGEALAGLSAIKTAFDLAQGLQKIHDAAARDRAVIELQKEILAAHAQQSALLEEASTLRKEVADLKALDADKARYERHEVSLGIIVYVLKPQEQGSEPFHMLCPKFYHDGKPSELQATQELRVGRRVHYCPRCRSEFVLKYVERVSTRPGQSQTSTYSLGDREFKTITPSFFSSVTTPSPSAT
jgi:myo-inositol catabolism protein IolC